MLSLPYLKRLVLDWSKLRNIIIWTIGTTILCGLTIKDFCPLLHEYTHNNVATQIKIISDNNFDKIPPVTFCIPRNPELLAKIAFQLKLSVNETFECLECDLMTERNWDTWSGINPNNSSTTHGGLHGAIAETLIIRLLENNEEKDFGVLSVNNLHWNQPLVEAVWEFFVCASMIDYEFGFDDQRRNELWCFRNQMADSLLADTGKIDQLYDRFLDILCAHIFFNDLNCSQFFKKIPNIIFEDSFCFSLPLRAKSDLQLFVKAYNKNKNYVLSSINSALTSFHLLSDLDEISWPARRVANNFAIHNSKDLAQYVDIKYRIEYSMVNKKESSCYHESTPAVCNGNCMTKRLIDKCQCVPFTFCNHLPSASEMPYCNTTMYSVCEFDTEMENEKCKKECKHRCEYTLYQWHVARSERQNKWRQFEMTISPIYTEFIEFSITVKNTWEQFLSQVGATFNFYLGFSGLSVVALIIHCCDWYSSKNLSEIEKSQRVTIDMEKCTNAEVSKYNNDAVIEYYIQQVIDIFKKELNLKADKLKIELKLEIAHLKKKLVRDKLKDENYGAQLSAAPPSCVTRLPQAL